MTRRVTVLGSTGSIGTQALKVARRYPDKIKVVGMSAGSKIDDLAAQVREFHPISVCVGNPDDETRLKTLLDGVKPIPEIFCGIDGLRRCAVLGEPDAVLNGIVGAAGFPPTIEALRHGIDVLLANKESLVMAGEIIRSVLQNSKAKIYPVDSEHSAIFQCLNGTEHPGLERIILTASGGPFLNKPYEEFDSITVGMALEHPTWKMGPKITIDSATMMNKGLEIIEAHYLFGLPPEKIDVVIHPASIVHSFVEFRDGSLLAQMSFPTMEIPIQYAMLYGERLPTEVRRFNPSEIGKLEFFEPEARKFPSIALARRALKQGGISPAVLNGANEEAVRLFLDEKIKFTDISNLVEYALDNIEGESVSEEGIIDADKRAREMVKGQSTRVG